jgi:hypothetical protein
MRLWLCRTIRTISSRHVQNHVTTQVKLVCAVVVQYSTFKIKILLKNYKRAREVSLTSELVVEIPGYLKTSDVDGFSLYATLAMTFLRVQLTDSVRRLCAISDAWCNDAFRDKGSRRKKRGVTWRHLQYSKEIRSTTKIKLYGECKRCSWLTKNHDQPVQSSRRIQRIPMAR